MTVALLCTWWLPAAATADVDLTDPHKTYIVVRDQVGNGGGGLPASFGKAVEPAAIEQLLGDRDVGQILGAQESPIGGHILFAAKGWAADRAGDTIYLYACADSWVMRTDGSQLIRITRACDSTSNDLGDVHTGSWLPNGTIFLSRSYRQEHRPDEQFAMESATDGQGVDHWNRRDLPGGRTVGFTPDQRYFFGSAVLAGSGAVVQWWAVDAATNQAYVLWESNPSSFGTWTERCADASPAGERYYNEITDKAVLAALTGPEPSCAFARPPVPEQEPAKPDSTVPATPTTPFSTPEPTPVAPTALTQLAAPGESGIAITAVTTRRSLAIRRGLRVALTNRGKAAKAWVLLLGDGGATTQVLARGTVATPKGAGDATFALSRTARTALRGGTSSKVLIRVSGTGNDGKPARAERTVTLAG